MKGIHMDTRVATRIPGPERDQRSVGSRIKCTWPLANPGTQRRAGESGRDSAAAAGRNFPRNRKINADSLGIFSEILARRRSRSRLRRGSAAGNAEDPRNLRKLPPLLLALRPAQVAGNSRHCAAEILY